MAVIERLHAQGGGVVEWNQMQLAYVFVADAPPGYRVGDFMPDEWGVAPECVTVSDTREGVI